MRPAIIHSTLLAESQRLGLKGRSGKPLSINGLSGILNNPFYTGIIKINSTEEVFAGKHEALISKSQFDRVQIDSARKDRQSNSAARIYVPPHDSLRGLRSRVDWRGTKGSSVLSLSDPGMPDQCVREEAIADAMTVILKRIKFNPDELQAIGRWIAEAHISETNLRDDELRGCRLRLDAARDRKNRLTDAFIDGSLDKTLFEERKAALLWEEKGIQDRISRNLSPVGRRRCNDWKDFSNSRMTQFSCTNAQIAEETRDLAKSLFSNLTVSLKHVVIEPKSSVQLLVDRPKTTYGSPSEFEDRTFGGVLSQL